MTILKNLKLIDEINSDKKMVGSVTLGVFMNQLNSLLKHNSINILYHLITTSAKWYLEEFTVYDKHLKLRLLPLSIENREYLLTTSVIKFPCSIPQDISCYYQQGL